MFLLYLIFTGAVIWSAYNLYRPIYVHDRLRVVSFLAGWLTGELALIMCFGRASCLLCSSGLAR